MFVRCSWERRAP